MFNKPRIRDYTSRNNSIEALPFHELGESCTLKNYELLVAEWSERYAVKLKSWVYPQILAHIGKWTPSRGETGLFSARELIRANCQDNWTRGVYWFVMSDHRALVKQYAQTEYCSLVPLILSAFKKFQDIPYHSWDRKEIQWAVSPKLLEAMMTSIPDYTQEEILQFRVQGLTMGPGSRNPGYQKSPLTTFGLYHLPKEMPDGRVGPGSLPNLVKMMICQTWCCHPQNRNRYMILDPNNWDRIPEALVDSEVIPQGDSSDNLVKLPWE